MTVPLAPGSSRGIHAQRFGQELRRAMLARKVGAGRLSEAAGVAKSAIANWKAGGNLPRVDTAARLAEVLDWPKLVDICREGRIVTCARCRRPFVNEGGAPARFCSVDCREVDVQLRRPGPGASLALVVRDELERRRWLVQRSTTDDVLDQALIEYQRSDSKRVNRQDKLVAQLDGVRAAVDAMCRGCEPAGICRSVECPLRPVSPLPLQVTDAGELRPVVDRDSPEYRERWLAAVRGANAERWARPGERERQSEQTSAYWAAMTDEERSAASARISEARRAS